MLVDTYVGTGLIPFNNVNDAYASMRHVAFAPSLNLAAGTLLGKITATGRYAAYNNALVTGVEVAVPLITQYRVITDASGNVTSLGIIPMPSAPCFTEGNFRCEDIVGEDAPGFVDIGAIIITGNITTGLFHF